MVAADGDQAGAVLGEFVGAGLEHGEGFFDVEGVADDVAGVGYLGFFEGEMLAAGLKGRSRREDSRTWLEPKRAPGR